MIMFRVLFATFALPVGDGCHDVMAVMMGCASSHDPYYPYYWRSL